MLLNSVIAALVAFAVAAALGPIIIPFLIRLKAGQTVRDEGPETHLKKNGTPTIGGLIFLGGMLVSSLLFVSKCPNIVPVLILTFGMAGIGFIDDYIKVVLKRSLGLRAWQKMLLQIILSTGFGLYVKYLTNVDLTMKVPFMPGNYIDLGIFTLPLLVLVSIATVNGTNFTDGLDGLASSVTLVVAVFFCVASIMTDSGVHPLAAAMAAGLAGFLLYNAFPAKVFMGDTGSLALGGFVAGMAYILQMPLLVIIIGIIYVVEVLSVIMQVSYFKITHGKRIFKMAPIHHHFELCGWSETRIVTVFTIVTALACIISLLGIW